jgi:hypothetical protein
MPERSSGLPTERKEGRKKERKVTKSIQIKKRWELYIYRVSHSPPNPAFL